jgi:hypothetical protein
MALINMLKRKYVVVLALINTLKKKARGSYGA